MAEVSWGHGLIEGAAEPINLLRPDFVVLSPASAFVVIGRSVRLTATAFYRDGTHLDVSRLGRWASANHAAVAVTNSGRATGQGSGSSLVTFWYGTASASAVVTTGGDLMLAARYPVTADDVSAGGDTFTITLDNEEADADYGAIAEVAEGDQSIKCQVPISGRTETQVTVLTTAPLEEGDIIEVFTARATS